MAPCGALVFLLMFVGYQCKDVTVKTNIGYLIGRTKDVELFGTKITIAEFLGIPYAEPPVGRDRFRKPIAKRPFSQPQLAHQFGPRCLEQFATDRSLGSEDCLYLNIFVPGKLHMESLAVMVYIHGGGFSQGSSQEYDCDLLTAFGNVLVVTINYRLNVWGFLRTDERYSPGNYGLWDQQLALKWVHDNIGAFGGDKNRVTIFGESAGAASVVHQALYPGNRGLIQRVIAQSGSASTNWGTREDPRQDANVVAREVGCYNESTQTMVDCLRNLPASKLQDAIDTLAMGEQIYFAPSIDNKFVTCSPSDILNLDINSDTYTAARDMFASVDLMIGMNSAEGALAFTLPSSGYGDPETYLPNKTHFDNVLVPALVDAVYGSMLGLPNTVRRPIARAVVDQYTSTNNPEDPYVIREQFIAMYGDLNFLATTDQTVKTHAVVSRRRTYLYYLTSKPFIHVLPTPTWVQGANHADDILYLFPSEIASFPAEHLNLAENMLGMWTNFAKTGNPNLPETVRGTWEEFTTANHYYMELTTNITSASLKQGLLEERAEFWNKVVPGIIDADVKRCRYVPETSGASRVQSVYSWTVFVVALLWPMI